MTEEPSRAVIKKVVLLAMQEKLDAKVKELEALEKDEKVHKYLELKAGVATLNAAVKLTEVEVARASVGAPSVESTAVRLRGSQFKIRSMGGKVLAMVKPYEKATHLQAVRQVLYSEMLAEFRGKSGVTASKVYSFFKRKFGVAAPTAKVHLDYAIQRGTAVKLTADKRGHGLAYKFPSQYDSPIIPEEEVREVSIEELRKAGLVK